MLNYQATATQFYYFDMPYNLTMYDVAREQTYAASVALSMLARPSLLNVSLGNT